MRETKLMLINYMCMILIGVTLFLHLATHAFLGVKNYQDSLTYQSVIGRYQAPATALMLTVLLLALCYHSVFSFRTLLLEALCYHSVFSFRTLLLEWRHGKVWDRAVNWGAVVGATVMVVFGMRTITAAYFGW